MEIFNLVTNDFVWKPRKAFTHPATPRHFLSVGGGASERGMAHRGETTGLVRLFFGGLLFAGGERRGGFGCVKAFGGFKLCKHYIMITCPCNVRPLTPHFYIVKLGFYGGVHYLLIFALKRGLWVLV